jgi:ABC-type taurine transport system ATPase subunit
VNSFHSALRMAALWELFKSVFGLAGKSSAKVVLVGLDGSGKTTILNHLKPGSVSIAPLVAACGLPQRTACTGPNV